MKCSWRNESNVWVTEHEELCKEHISYYQWIPYVLIIQVSFKASYSYLSTNDDHNFQKDALVTNVLNLHLSMIFRDVLYTFLELFGSY